MRKTIKNLAALVTVIILSSFSNKHSYDFIGTYGVSAADPSQIKLTINPDHTFYYKDCSVPAKKIVVTGSWKLKGRKVILHDQAKTRFHKVWTFEQNGQIAKSRRGLAFYRLGKINS